MGTIRGFTCNLNICRSFGDIERLDDKTVRCMDHGVVYNDPVDSVSTKIAETSSKTFIEESSKQLSEE